MDNKTNINWYPGHMANRNILIFRLFYLSNFIIEKTNNNTPIVNNAPP